MRFVLLGLKAVQDEMAVRDEMVIVVRKVDRAVMVNLAATVHLATVHLVKAKDVRLATVKVEVLEMVRGDLRADVNRGLAMDLRDTDLTVAQWARQTLNALSKMLCVLMPTRTAN